MGKSAYRPETYERLRLVQIDRRMQGTLDKYKGVAAPPKNGAGDPEVVSAKKLGMILKACERVHDAYHENEQDARGYCNFDDVTQIGFTAWLSDETGLAPKRIYDLLHARQKWVGVGVADVILQALGLTHMLGNDINVVPNPRWSQERWHAWMAGRGCGDEG